MTRPVTNIACRRVQESLEEGLAEGLFHLPPEQMAHAARCPVCGPQVRETERLLARLRSAGAAVDLGPAMRVVDCVLAQTNARTPATANAPQIPALQSSRPASRRDRKVRTGWVLGQVAVVAAALLITVGALTYVALGVQHAVAGTNSGSVVEHLTAPFRNWAEAWVKGRD